MFNCVKKITLWLFLWSGLFGYVYASTAAVRVKVALPVQRDVPVTVAAIGQLEAIQQVTLSAQTSGRIRSIDFKNGSVVVKGEPVVQLDDGIARTNYAEAKTNLALAQQKYSRSKKISNYVSSQELATLQADVQTKSAELDSAFVQMQQRKVVAPFSGQLGAFNYSEADYVSAGDPIVKLFNTQVLRVNYSLPGKYKNQLKKGQSIAVTVAQYPGKTFFATLDYISPIIDSDTRTVAVHALLPNPQVKRADEKIGQALLSPGLLVSVRQDVSVERHAVLIPDIAVNTDYQGNYVYVIKNDKAIKSYIKEGRHIKNLVQAVSGVSLTDRVVVAGQQKLTDHDTVLVVNSR